MCSDGNGALLRTIVSVIMWQEDEMQLNTNLNGPGKTPYFGKKFSILGDSISTLDGYNPIGYHLFYTGEIS